MSEAKGRWGAWVALLWLATFIALLLMAAGDGDAYDRSVALARALGWQSVTALVAALCVTPISRWLQQASKLRRALGLAAVTSALIHALITISTSPLRLREQLVDAHLRFGFGALLLLVLLGLTSFPRVVARLHLRSWKELHRLAYIAWLCAVLHAFLSPYAWMAGVIGMTLVVMVAAAARLWPRPRRTP
jgi:sulfoxide reductase heme-binding subunit YedZ